MNGPQGAVSHQCALSVEMIEKELRRLRRLLDTLNPEYNVNLHTCLTVQVENLHALSHFKSQFPTMLLYARNLANTVNESIKRVVPWAAYYYTHEKSYYPVLKQSTPLERMPKMDHLKPVSNLSNEEQNLMREWASTHGKAVRQRSVRQETTMFKAGTLPLNMYMSSKLPVGRIEFETGEDNARDNAEKAADANTEENEEEIHQDQGGTKEGEEDVLEQPYEYDTDSDVETEINGNNADSDEEDNLTFLGAITTRSGRQVRVRNV